MAPQPKDLIPDRNCTVCVKHLMMNPGLLKSCLRLELELVDIEMLSLVQKKHFKLNHIELNLAVAVES